MIKCKMTPSEILSDIWTDIKWDGIAKEGNVELKNAKKPEKLLERIIELSTNKQDLIMDFHLGSGTTCAVAHKMNRRYIGIEQMDYIEDITVERVKKVMEKNNQGDFVYAELKAIDNFTNSPIAQLNKNMQYLPISEIEDEEYAISQKEIVINKKFYGLENE